MKSNALCPLTALHLVTFVWWNLSFLCARQKEPFHSLIQPWRKGSLSFGWEFYRTLCRNSSAEIRRVLRSTCNICLENWRISSIYQARGLTSQHTRQIKLQIWAQNKQLANLTYASTVNNYGQHDLLGEINLCNSMIDRSICDWLVKAPTSKFPVANWSTSATWQYHHPAFLLCLLISLPSVSFLHGGFLCSTVSLLTDRPPGQETGCSQR